MSGFDLFGGVPVMDDGRTCDIYTLSDPRNGAVRYVGKSTQVEMRYYNHLDYAKRPGRKFKSTNWIRQLLALGLKPVMTVIETVPYDQWADRERFWIAHHKAIGADLTNHNDGGYGPWEVSPETSAKLSAATARRNRLRKGQPASDAARAAWSAAQKRRIANMSDEERREYTMRMVRKRRPGWNRGWKMSDETKAKIGAANSVSRRKGYQLTDGHKAAISAGLKKRRLA